MKPIHYILICCLLGLVGCSKEPDIGLGEGQCSYCGPTFNLEAVEIKSVNYLPINLQSITLVNNNCCNNLVFSEFSIEHSADTNTYYIPNGTVLPYNDSITFTGAQLGFVVDTIADTVFLMYADTQIVDTWSH